VVIEDPFQKTSVTIQHIKELGEEQKAFIDDLVPVIVKGLFFYNTSKKIWMKLFGSRRDPQLIFFIT
jgi:hypothetical protein